MKWNETYPINQHFREAHAVTYTSNFGENVQFSDVLIALRTLPSVMWALGLGRECGQHWEKGARRAVWLYISPTVVTNISASFKVGMISESTVRCLHKRFAREIFQAYVAVREVVYGRNLDWLARVRSVGWLAMVGGVLLPSHAAHIRDLDQMSPQLKQW